MSADEDLSYREPDQPHVVVIVGQEPPKMRRYANVEGPYPTRAKAVNARNRIRRKAVRAGVLDEYRLTFHVRPLMPPEGRP